MKRRKVTGLMKLHFPDVGVGPFESPRLALARFAKQEVSTVVSDLKMYELDGFALLRGAKVLRPNVPLILFSGHVDAALTTQAINMGAHDVLQKPFHRKEFVTVLTVAVTTYDLAREVRVRRFNDGTSQQAGGNLEAAYRGKLSAAQHDQAH
jgi:two-component system, NtrC family, C4-dicarboxylate transport response regulator DctD